MAIKPMGNRVIMVADAAIDKTNTGIYLTDSAKVDSNVATVLACGPECAVLKDGDRVLFDLAYARPYTVEGNSCLISRETDIVAVIDGEGE